jgi:hypothetical protein
MEHTPAHGPEAVILWLSLSGEVVGSQMGDSPGDADVAFVDPVVEEWLWLLRKRCWRETQNKKGLDERVF